MAATAFCTSAMPSPRLMPSNRPVTATRRCRFSRMISVWPASSAKSASEPSVAVFPVEALVMIVLRIWSSVARVFSGKRTRMVYARSFTTTGVVAGSPWRIALASSSISCGLKPARAATTGSTLITMAGPLMLFSIPSFTSTTPLIFLTPSATLGAHCLSKAGS